MRTVGVKYVQEDGVNLSGTEGFIGVDSDVGEQKVAVKVVSRNVVERNV
jgi:hypothetical protein